MNIISPNDFVLQEMFAHIDQFVEAPNPAFGGLPLCPFSKKFRAQNKIKWIVMEISLEKIYELGMDDAYIMTFIIDPRKNWPIQELESMKMMLELIYPEHNLFTGHPESVFCINDIYTRREPYPNIQFIKRSIMEKLENVLN